MRKRWIFLIVLVAGFVPAIASAATGSLSHAYQASGDINAGNIVSFVKDKSSYVRTAQTTDGARVAGVAVASQGSLLAIDPSMSSVQVAVGGSAPVLVSTLNGPIKVGDQISVSPIDGVGMKNDQTTGWAIVGVAQTAFNEKSSGASTRQIVKTGGGKTSVVVGYVRLSLTIGAATNSGGQDLTRLQELFKNFTGKTISTARIVVAIVVTTMTVLTLSVLLYASIHSSLIALGRNPLAKASILRGLRSVLLLSLLIVLIAGLTDVFLLR